MSYLKISLKVIFFFFFLMPEYITTDLLYVVKIKYFIVYSLRQDDISVPVKLQKNYLIKIT